MHFDKHKSDSKLTNQKSIFQTTGNCKNLNHRKNSRRWQGKIEIEGVFMVLIVCVALAMEKEMMAEEAQP